MISTIPKWAGELLESVVGQRAEVIHATYLSPYLKKVRFRSNIAHMNFQIGYASVIRVNDIEYRNYTIAYHDIGTGILDIIFHLHDNGPGSQYAHSLNIGDQLISVAQEDARYISRRSNISFFLEMKHRSG
ncbi:siderophore-interacting protein [Sphingobacterium sp. KU25419]|nr:siderophore-interacting protein [Sphingobacterium sp. KU25419]